MGILTEKNRRELKKNPNYNNANLDNMIENDFSIILDELIIQKNMTTQEIVDKTGISKAHINNLRNRKRKDIHPSRIKVINIGLALGCSEEEINSLLKATGLQPLYSRSKEESVIIWGLLHGKNYEQILDLLDEKGFGAFLE